MAKIYGHPIFPSQVCGLKYTVFPVAPVHGRSPRSGIFRSHCQFLVVETTSMMTPKITSAIRAPSRSEKA